MPECQSEHLDTDTDGELILKQGHALPPLAVQLGYIKVRNETTMSNLTVPPKFSFGQVLATPAALQTLEDAGQSPAFFLDCHIQGNWGEVNDEDKRLNDQALVDGSRLLSAYKTLKGERLWIITEAADDEGKRAATTILTPSEY